MLQVINMNKSMLLLSMAALCISQQYKKYCYQKGCDANTHMLCIYGDKPVNEKCGKITRIPWDRETIKSMIDQSNSERISIANGIETLSNGKVLPKAYAMSKMHWDEELAQIAETWSLQCLNPFDFCIATDKHRFANSINRWHHGHIKNGYINGTDWYNINKCGATQQQLSRKFTKPLTNERIFPCISNVWHTAQAIGCYSVYEHSKDATRYRCIISDGYRRGNTALIFMPPKGGSPKCGCHPGWREVEGCLCEEIPKFITTPSVMSPYYEVTYNEFKGPTETVIFVDDPGEVFEVNDIRFTKSSTKKDQTNKFNPFFLFMDSDNYQTQLYQFKTFTKSPQKNNSKFSKFTPYFLFMNPTSPSISHSLLDSDGAGSSAELGPNRKTFVERFFNSSLQLNSFETIRYGDKQDNRRDVNYSVRHQKESGRSIVPNTDNDFYDLLKHLKIKSNITYLKPLPLEV